MSGDITEPNPEPWRRHVAEVADTMIACQAALFAAGISHSVGDLVEMARPVMNWYLC
jgi:hypothetical protein